jgi:hypothetical protein
MLFSCAPKFVHAFYDSDSMRNHISMDSLSSETFLPLGIHWRRVIDDEMVNERIQDREWPGRGVAFRARVRSRLAYLPGPDAILC